MFCLTVYKTFRTQLQDHILNPIPFSTKRYCSSNSSLSPTSIVLFLLDHLHQHTVRTDTVILYIWKINLGIHPFITTPLHHVFPPFCSKSSSVAYIHDLQILALQSLKPTPIMFVTPSLDQNCSSWQDLTPLRYISGQFSILTLFDLSIALNTDHS